MLYITLGILILIYALKSQTKRIKTLSEKDGLSLCAQPIIINFCISVVSGTVKYIGFFLFRKTCSSLGIAKQLLAGADG